jgi:gliding motility-associated-like protein
LKTVLIAYLILISSTAWAQFPVTGQLPTTAFPVCGSSVYKQANVPLGYTGVLQVPGCDSYPDVNAFYYTFICYKAGTLGFLITPNNLGDDYDWQLFDITGHNADDIYTDISLVVTGNWSATYGKTGARTGGSNKIECASLPDDKITTFSAMPNLILGHRYLLMISHYTNTQSGYTLSFGGGTADIKDPTLPDLLSVTASCDRKTLMVILNKNMRCTSLDPDGSDFTIAANPVTIVSATGSNCGNGFDMDTVLLTLSANLSPGNYSLRSQVGNDGNTLLDDCGAQIPAGNSLDFTISPVHFTPFDSLTAPQCAPTTLQLVFSDPIQCSSIAPDGSDFMLTGNPAFHISGVRGNCSAGGLTNVINLTLNTPIVSAGNFQISLVTGSDGNTIINACGLQTPVSSVDFSTKDTVSAAFTYQVGLGCTYDTIAFSYLPANGVNQWEWTIDSTTRSILLSPVILNTVFGDKHVQHIVSNGFCSDTAIEIVSLPNILQANFTAPQEVCPKDVIAFTNTSVGNIVSWNWDFGDGTSSMQQSPPSHRFPDTQEGKTYTVSLTVKDTMGCYRTFSEQITKLQSCYITVPNAFTPNNDGKNDFLYPLNAYTATDLGFQVFNRFGQLVFETRDWTHKWDGTMGGMPQGTGTYVWMLRYTDGSSGKKVFLKGTTVLIR